MAGIRRSTRLSSGIDKETTNFSATSKSLRRAGVWQHRKSTLQQSDDEEDHYSNCSTEENNENCDLINKMHQLKRSNKRSVTKKTSKAEEPKTPQSKMKPIPITRKKELMKRQAVGSEDEITNDTEDTEQVSPSKQARQTNGLPQQHVESPSRLLDRLSIDEKSEEVNETDMSPKKMQVKTTLTATPKRNKYQNARRVLNSAECQNLPGREQQLDELRSFLREHLEYKKSGSLYVSGQPGTGKTACLSVLLRSPEFNKCLQTVYVNCTSIASIGGVYKKLCSELNLKPQGRTERDHLQALQLYFKNSPRMLLIVLDEIDQLCSLKQSVLYTIFEWPSIPNAKILLVGIANSLDLTERALMRLNARCELKPKHMHFPPYTKQQIVDIFKSRLEEADVLDIFPPVTLQLLAGKVSAISGDVRRALDIGRRVVEIAEQQKKAGEREIDLKNLNLAECNQTPNNKEFLKPVQITQVAAVLNNVYGASQNLQEDMDESFPLQQKLMLCSLMLMLRNEKNKDITMGRLHEVYRRVCNKRNIHPVDQAEFGSLVDLVQTRGILRIIKKKEPRLGKIQLQWDEEEVNAALRDKQLIASILDDTACLAK